MVINGLPLLRSHQAVPAVGLVAFEHQRNGPPHWSGTWFCLPDVWARFNMEEGRQVVRGLESGNVNC